MFMLRAVAQVRREASRKAIRSNAIRHRNSKLIAYRFVALAMNQGMAERAQWIVSNIHVRA
jgi:hypothetical protein